MLHLKNAQRDKSAGLQCLLLFTFSISPIKPTNEGMLYVFIVYPLWKCLISKFSRTRMWLHCLDHKIRDEYF